MTHNLFCIRKVNLTEEHSQFSFIIYNLKSRSECLERKYTNANTFISGTHIQRISNLVESLCQIKGKVCGIKK